MECERNGVIRREQRGYLGLPDFSGCLNISIMLGGSMKVCPPKITGGSEPFSGELATGLDPFRSFVGAGVGTDSTSEIEFDQTSL